MTPERKQELEEFNKTQLDWYGTCRKCGECVRGSPIEILAHKKVCDGKGK